MDLKENDVAYIQKAFQKMKSKNDFLALLNFAKKLIYGENTIAFRLTQINYHAYIKTAKNNYRVFEINKKSGGKRTIMAPQAGLKSVQKVLNLIFQCVFTPVEQATGFVKQRSIVDNAKRHVGSNYVYNIDLKDFFPGIDQPRIWKCLQNPPFRLSARRLELVNLITALCCVEMEVERKDGEGNWTLQKKRVLPQGAPTSPTLSNVVCQKLDFLLNGVAKRFGLRYTRYADDITFSSMHNVYQKDSDFIKEVHRIIGEQNFYIKNSKVRLQKTGYRQEVTGLTVNAKVNVNKKFIKQIRLWLYLWESYGIERARELIWSDYSKGKGQVMTRPSIDNLIHGKLEYLKMAKGAADGTYQKLLKKFKPLQDEAIKLKKSLTPPPGLLDYWKESENADNSHDPEYTRKNGKLLPHNPLYTVSFLKLFKFRDDMGFKELVHDVDIDPVKVEGILTKVKRHPNFIYRYHKEKVLGIQFLNEQIQTDVIDLINKFEREASKSLAKKPIKHPFTSSKSYAEYVIRFKKKYRYGSGREYSKLLEDIHQLIKETQVDRFTIRINPSDERSFALRASFFAWQPSVLKGLKYIFEGIRDHSNINGKPIGTEQKKTIQIQCERKGELENSHIEVSILDYKSKCLILPEKLLDYLKNSPPFKDNFRNICDWTVECDFFEGSSMRYNLLSTTPSVAQETLTKSVGGFRHILKFYENNN